MARAHKTSTLPNSPNYYWEQAINYDAIGYEIMANVYLFLFYMATLGE